MAGADVTRIDRVVVEILAPQNPVFVADQPVFLDPRRIEFDLDFHVLGDGQQSGAHLLHQHLVRFLQGVDVGVVTIAGIGQLFHQPIVVVAGAETERGQGDTAFALGFDQVFQRLEVDGTDVKIAVGRHDHSVDTVFDKTFAGEIVGQLNAGTAVGGTARA